ncbi:MAG: hypothetical protein DYG89_49270 [Caldilinea sp. CFX5]|nr:hypothetical protein [Caldilinea sp. CFX5]
MRTSVRYWLILLLFLTQAFGTTPVMAAPLRQSENLPLESPVELAVGDEILVGESPDGLYIFYGGVMYDKRCPVGQKCEKDGNALFQLIVSSEDRQESEILEIGTAADRQTTDFGDYSIELTAIDPPAPKPGENIVLIDYVLTLIVRPGGEATPTPEPTAELKTETTLRQEQATGPEPIIVDRCVNFTPFDAAAVLQEPVNGEEPIGNLLFGPLPSDLLSDGEMLQGLCGYVAGASAEVNDRSQTHIATAIEAAHAVAAQQLTAEVTPNSNGTIQSDVFTLMLLAEAMGAANPKHDSEELFNVLYNFAGHFPLLEMLQYDADQAPSFQVQALEPTQTESYDELFWFWQTLDDGYFSLLVGRTGLDFDLVAARLGPQVQEAAVLGYSRVILGKLRATPSASDTGGPTSGGAVGCDLLTLDEVEGILQDTVDMHAVANEEGDGCKYTYIDDAQSIDPTDFSNGFASHGLLVGVVPPKAAQKLLDAMIQELATTGNVQDGDALQALLDSLNAEDWSNTLAQIATLAWDSSIWQVTALSKVSDDTLFVTGEANGWPRFFVLRPHADGGIYYMMGVLPMAVDTVRDAIIVAARNLADPTDESGQAPVESGESSTTENPAPKATKPGIGCTLANAEMVAELVGAAVDAHPVAGERGEGCIYTPQAEQATIDPTDFSPNFATAGAMIGIMPGEDALWMLESLPAELEDSGLDADALDPLRAALDAEDVPQALAALAALDGQGDRWRVTALPEVSERAASLYGTPDDSVHVAFFMQAQDDGTLLIIIIQRTAAADLAGLHDLVVAILQQR